VSALSLALAFIIGLGLAVGFRFHNSAGACLAGVARQLGAGPRVHYAWLAAAIRPETSPPTVTINAVRALFEGGPVYHDLCQAALWCVGIFAVFLAISLNLHRKATA
jgi:hypothetical protein